MTWVFTALPNTLSLMFRLSLAVLGPLPITADRYLAEPQLAEGGEGGGGGGGDILAGVRGVRDQGQGYAAR